MSLSAFTSNLSLIYDILSEYIITFLIANNNVTVINVVIVAFVTPIKTHRIILLFTNSNENVSDNEV